MVMTQWREHTIFRYLLSMKKYFEFKDYSKQKHNQTDDLIDSNSHNLVCFIPGLVSRAGTDAKLLNHV